MSVRWYVPGRLEVLGTHTDYAGGSTLLAAMNRGVTVTLEPSPEGTWVASSASDDPVQADSSEPLPPGHWGNYVRTVYDRLVANFGELKPAALEVDSTLPLASGMSSSSALMVAMALALIDDNDLRDSAAWQENIHTDLDLATYLSTIENGMTFRGLEGRAGVGTFGGSEDHTAMIACEEGKLSHFTFCPSTHVWSVRMPDDWAFVIAVSGVLAEKTGAALDAYNQASADARKLVTAWNEVTGDSYMYLADLLGESQNITKLRKIAAERGLQNRLEAYLTESEVLIPAALAALERKDLAAFGQAANLSHQTLDEVLGNQVPATNFLQETAVELGAAGATSFGAGFGGSVWAVLPKQDADAFAEAWEQSYAEKFPQEATRAAFIVATPGPAAHRL